VGVCALDSRRVLRVEGEDARSWLNAVLTQDLRSPLGAGMTLALFVDVRGRVLADADVFQAGDAINVLIPAAGAPALISRLEERIVMEDVTLSLPDMAVFTAQGPAAADMPSAARGLAHDRLGRGGFDLVCAPPAADALRDALADEALALGGALVSGEAYERARVRARRPRFGADFGPDCYPQEAGLESLRVSFDKGCYVGQEAVHMLQVRGRPPRRLVGLAIEGDALPALGADVRTADGRSVGVVTSAAPARDGHPLALAMLKRAAAEAEDTLELDQRVARRIGLVGAEA